ncbi:MAG: hypothetical protein JXR83_00565 [Deltaproteobacteria bacterium]|nr:hypothetical protein [Deltaproteobacteria bacterium]
MSLFNIGLALLFPTLLILVTYLLVRIAWSARRTNRALEQTNQKLERVVAELRMMRLRQLGEAPARPSVELPAEVPAEVPQALPEPSPPVVVIEQPAKPPEPPPEPAPPAEVFAADVKCYYCGRGQPVTRYLGQPICAGCRQNALLTDEPAK